MLIFNPDQTECKGEILRNINNSNEVGLLIPFFTLAGHGRIAFT
jgi:hypothetical protein